jgi:hypothetical protein
MHYDNPFFLPRCAFHLLFLYNIETAILPWFNCTTLFWVPYNYFYLMPKSAKMA